eukprot:11184753-Karenia_brevis.AAC.1
MQMQRARLLALDRAKQSVAAAEDTALRKGIATKSVLARMLAFVTMWAIGAHAHAKQPCQHYPYQNFE